MSHHFRDNGNFNQKAPTFPTPCILRPDEGVPLAIGYRRTRSNLSKHYSEGATGPNKKFDDIFSRVDTIHQRDGRTDRHLTTAMSVLIRIASHG